MSDTRNVIVAFDGSGDMVAKIDCGCTLDENLGSLIPIARQRGLLPIDDTEGRFRALHDDRELNGDVPLAEGIERLLVVPVPTQMRLRVRFTPDHLEETSRTLTVNPQQPLEPQIRDDVRDILQSHTFRARRRKGWRITAAGKSLDICKPLAKQGIDTDTEVNLRPGMWLGWPPRFLEFALAGILVASAAFLVWKYRPQPLPQVNEFHVLLQADTECRVDFGPEERSVGSPVLLVSPKATPACTLRRGFHECDVFPRDYPIFRSTLDVPTEMTSRDTSWVEIDVRDRWAGAGPIRLIIQGFWIDPDGHVQYSASNRIRADLLVNRFAHEPGSVGEVVLNVPRGPYDVRFALENRLFRHLKLGDTEWHGSFRVDLTHYIGDQALLTLFYRRPSPS